MPSHLIFFLSILSFLSGIAFAGLGLPFLFAVAPAAILFAALFISNAGVKISVLAAALLIAGSFYYFLNDYNYQTAVARLPSGGEVKGLVVSQPESNAETGVQSFYLRTGAGKILVETGSDVSYSYGDTLAVAGDIKIPPQSYYGKYLSKEGAVGIMNNPSVSRLASGGGNKIITFLYNLRRGIRGSFKSLLGPEEAAFLSGVTLGINSDFSKSFLQNISLSGVRHLTAISGLHMTIVIFIIFSVFLYLLPRRYAFILTFIFVCLFTALTGFTVSAIRAAIIAFIAGLAKETGRLYAPHNALALAALVLVLFNPKVLVFDVGFQLSFLAVISIIYFAPVLRHLFKISDSPGFLGWKQSLLTTISAQLMTAPILIAQFQNFSLIAFAANVLILVTIPYIIGLGFLMSLLYFLFAPLASLISLIVAPLVDYVILVINLFGRFAVLFNPSLGFVGMAAYYGIIVVLMYGFYEWRGRKAEKDKISRRLVE